MAGHFGARDANHMARLGRGCAFSAHALCPLRSTYLALGDRRTRARSPASPRRSPRGAKLWLPDTKARFHVPWRGRVGASLAVLARSATVARRLHERRRAESSASPTAAARAVRCRRTRSRPAATFGCCEGAAVGCAKRRSRRRRRRGRRIEFQLARRRRRRRGGGLLRAGAARPARGIIVSATIAAAAVMGSPPRHRRAARSDDLRRRSTRVLAGRRWRAGGQIDASAPARARVAPTHRARAAGRPPRADHRRREPGDDRLQLEPVRRRRSCMGRRRERRQLPRPRDATARRDRPARTRTTRGKTAPRRRRRAEAGPARSGARRRGAADPRGTLTADGRRLLVSRATPQQGPVGTRERGFGLRTLHVGCETARVVRRATATSASGPAVQVPSRAWRRCDARLERELALLGVALDDGAHGAAQPHLPSSPALARRSRWRRCACPAISGDADLSRGGARGSGFESMHVPDEDTADVDLVGRLVATPCRARAPTIAVQLDAD